MTTFGSSQNGEKKKTSLQSKKRQKGKQRPTSGVGRKKGGDRSQKRNGH